MLNMALEQSGIAFGFHRQHRALPSQLFVIRPQAERLMAILKVDPYGTPPPYEKLVGDFAGACSRRINIQHRMVYQVLDDIKTVKVIRMWTHYE